jgi:hypothetical protein
MFFLLLGCAGPTLTTSKKDYVGNVRIDKLVIGVEENKLIEVWTAYARSISSKEKLDQAERKSRVFLEALKSALSVEFDSDVKVLRLNESNFKNRWDPKKIIEIESPEIKYVMYVYLKSYEYLYANSSINIDPKVMNKGEFLGSGGGMTFAAEVFEISSARRIWSSEINFKLLFNCNFDDYQTCTKDTAALLSKQMVADGLVITKKNKL